MIKLQSRQIDLNEHLSKNSVPSTCPKISISSTMGLERMSKEEIDAKVSPYWML